MDSPEPEERFWAAALAELQTAPRPGLWAMAFAQANGNDSQARAIYLRESAKGHQARYADEMRVAREEAHRVVEQQTRQRLHAAAHAAAYARLPKGSCPNCAAILLLSAETCSACQADFSSNSLFKVRPLGPVVDG